MQLGKYLVNNPVEGDNAWYNYDVDRGREQAEKQLLLTKAMKSPCGLEWFILMENSEDGNV